SRASEKAGHAASSLWGGRREANGWERTKRWPIVSSIRERGAAANRRPGKTANPRAHRRALILRGPGGSRRTAHARAGRWRRAPPPGGAPPRGGATLPAPRRELLGRGARRVAIDAGVRGPVFVRREHHVEHHPRMHLPQGLLHLSADLVQLRYRARSEA